MTSAFPPTPDAAAIERRIRAIHYYGDPPDSRLRGMVVDADVEDIMVDVRALVEENARLRNLVAASGGEGVGRDEVVVPRAWAEQLSAEELLSVAEAVEQAGGRMMQWPSVLRAKLGELLATAGGTE